MRSISELDVPQSSNTTTFETPLSGDQEVPAIKTSASGIAAFTVNADMTVLISISTNMGSVATAAYIHEAGAGKIGTAIISLIKQGDSWRTASPGTKLTEAQCKALQAGNLYVNVCSAAHTDGELRGQLRTHPHPHK